MQNYSSSEEMVDRRQSERVPLLYDVYCSLLFLPKDYRIRCALVDVSARGVGIATHEKIPTTETAILEIDQTKIDVKIKWSCRREASYFSTLYKIFDSGLEGVDPALNLRETIMALVREKYSAV